MFGKYSAAAILTVLNALSSQTNAFELRLYINERCTGSPVVAETAVSNGCQTDGAGNAAAIINSWKNDTDNNLLLATYSDEKCCHASLIETSTWTDGCTKIEGGVHSWRVLDPNEPDAGKEGETYTCEPKFD